VRAVRTVDETRENRSRRLGSVRRREETDAVRLAEGKPKGRWSDAIGSDAKRTGISVDENAGNRVEWKFGVAVPEWSAEKGGDTF